MKPAITQTKSAGSQSHHTLVTEAGNYTNLSASAQVRAGPGALLGVFVASSSSGTIKLWDSLTAANAIIINTTSVTGGTFYPIPVVFGTGLYCTIAGTADITVLWSEA